MPTLPTIPVGVPSTLLQRRSDIATAKRQMAAENAAIGVAVAVYYPTISLGGSATETIFDGGERSGEIAAAKAAYQATVANYRGTVLTAFQDVENDLLGLRILAEQSDALDAAVRDATHGAEIAFNEYQGRHRGLHDRGDGPGDPVEQSANGVERAGVRLVGQRTERPRHPENAASQASASNTVTQ